jgi:two-component system, cell cycle sensor histidine kinase and response regulator CckA
VGADGHEKEAVLWRALVEASPDIVLVVDPDGTVLFSNRVAPTFADRGVVGRKIWEFAVGDDARARLQDRLREVVETRRAVFYENPGILADGSEGWYEVRGIPVVIDGRIDRIVWSATDISERRRTVERLAFQAHLLDQVSQPIVAVDPSSRFTHWNAAAERLYGWTAQEAVGRITHELLQTEHPSPGGKEAMSRTIRSTGSWSGELLHVTKGGERITVHLSVRMIRDDRGEPVQTIGVIQDVTARKRLEEQLRQSQKMEAIGLLAGGVAHDFNNILAVILGFSELAVRKLPPGHPVAAQLTEVFDAARRGGELTRKLLAFSRKQIIQPRLLDVCASVEDFTRMIRRIVGEDVEIVVEPSSAAVPVRADPVQLEQVLLNLCTNARQAMPAGGTLRLTTRPVDLDEAFVERHPWARAGGFAEVVVSDTGVGMDAATRARVFEPFFTTKPEGTGLGLATVYGIVEQHGGFVHVESTPGAGTTFRVFLPRSGDGTPVPREVNGVHATHGPRGTELVIVAEDEPSLRSLVTTTLTELGYRVIAASDGEQAIREYELHADHVALVLLDVVMPHLDARETYERLRAVRPHVRVLFTTGYAPSSTRLAELLQSGRVPVLEKPFTPQALAAKVRRAIDA